MTYLTLKVDDPALNIEKMELNMIVFMVGKNGTGKTFVMITNYCLANLLYSIHIGKVPAEAIKPLAQEMFDKSFEEVDWTGELGYYIDDTTFISVQFDKGQITEVNWSITNANSIVPAKFLSKSTRQFEFIIHYLRARRALINQQMPDEHTTKMLLSQYKLYDMTFIESLIGRSPIHIEDPQRFKDFDFKVLPVAMHVDYDVCTIQIEMEDGTFRSGTRFSAGEQALLIMFFGI